MKWKFPKDTTPYIRPPRSLVIQSRGGLTGDRENTFLQAISLELARGRHPAEVYFEEAIPFAGRLGLDPSSINYPEQLKAFGEIAKLPSAQEDAAKKFADILQFRKRVSEAGVLDYEKWGSTILQEDSDEIWRDVIKPGLIERGIDPYSPEAKVFVEATLGFEVGDLNKPEAEGVLLALPGPQKYISDITEVTEESAVRRIEEGRASEFRRGILVDPNEPASGGAILGPEDLISSGEKGVGWNEPVSISTSAEYLSQRLSGPKAQAWWDKIKDTTSISIIREETKKFAKTLPPYEQALVLKVAEQQVLRAFDFYKKTVGNTFAVKFFSENNPLEQLERDKYIRFVDPDRKFLNGAADVIINDAINLSVGLVKGGALFIDLVPWATASAINYILSYEPRDVGYMGIKYAAGTPVEPRKVKIPTIREELNKLWPTLSLESGILQFGGSIIGVGMVNKLLQTGAQLSFAKVQNSYNLRAAQEGVVLTEAAEKAALQAEQIGLALSASKSASVLRAIYHTPGLKQVIDAAHKNRGFQAYMRTVPPATLSLDDIVGNVLTKAISVVYNKSPETWPRFTQMLDKVSRAYITNAMINSSIGYSSIPNNVIETFFELALQYAALGTKVFMEKIGDKNFKVFRDSISSLDDLIYTAKYGKPDLLAGVLRTQRGVSRKGVEGTTKQYLGKSPTVYVPVPRPPPPLKETKSGNVRHPWMQSFVDKTNARLGPGKDISKRNFFFDMADDNYAANIVIQEKNKESEATLTKIARGVEQIVVPFRKRRYRQKDFVRTLYVPSHVGMVPITISDNLLMEAQNIARAVRSQSPLWASQEVSDIIREIHGLSPEDAGLAMIFTNYLMTARMVRGSVETGKDIFLKQGPASKKDILEYLKITDDVINAYTGFSDLVKRRTDLVTKLIGSRRSFPHLRTMNELLKPLEVEKGPTGTIVVDPGKKTGQREEKALYASRKGLSEGLYNFHILLGVIGRESYSPPVWKHWTLEGLSENITNMTKKVESINAKHRNQAKVAYKKKYKEEGKGEAAWKKLEGSDKGKEEIAAMIKSRWTAQDTWRAIKAFVEPDAIRLRNVLLTDPNFADVADSIKHRWISAHKFNRLKSPEKREAAILNEITENLLLYLQQSDAVSSFEPNAYYAAWEGLHPFIFTARRKKWIPAAPDNRYLTLFNRAFGNAHPVEPWVAPGIAMYNKMLAGYERAGKRMLTLGYMTEEQYLARPNYVPMKAGMNHVVSEYLPFLDTYFTEPRTRAKATAAKPELNYVKERDKKFHSWIVNHLSVYAKYMQEYWDNELWTQAVRTRLGMFDIGPNIQKLKKMVYGRMRVFKGEDPRNPNSWHRNVVLVRYPDHSIWKTIRDVKKDDPILDPKSAAMLQVRSPIILYVDIPANRAKHVNANGIGDLDNFAARELNYFTDPGRPIPENYVRFQVVGEAGDLFSRSIDITAELKREQAIQHAQGYDESFILSALERKREQLLQNMLSINADNLAAGKKGDIYFPEIPWTHISPFDSNIVDPDIQNLTKIYAKAYQKNIREPDSYFHPEFFVPGEKKAGPAWVGWSPASGRRLSTASPGASAVSFFTQDVDASQYFKQVGEDVSLKFKPGEFRELDAYSFQALFAGEAGKTTNMMIVPRHVAEALGDIENKELAGMWRYLGEKTVAKPIVWTQSVIKKFLIAGPANYVRYQRDNLIYDIFTKIVPDIGPGEWKRYLNEDLRPMMREYRRFLETGEMSEMVQLGLLHNVIQSSQEYAERLIQPHRKQAKALFDLMEKLEDPATLDKTLKGKIVDYLSTLDLFEFGLATSSYRESITRLSFFHYLLRRQDELGYLPIFGYTGHKYLAGGTPIGNAALVTRQRFVDYEEPITPFMTEARNFAIPFGVFFESEVHGFWESMKNAVHLYQSGEHAQAWKNVATMGMRAGSGSLRSLATVLFTYPIALYAWNNYIIPLITGDPPAELGVGDYYRYRPHANLVWFDKEQGKWVDKDKEGRARVVSTPTGLSMFLDYVFPLQNTMGLGPIGAYRDIKAIGNWIDIYVKGPNPYTLEGQVVLDTLPKEASIKWSSVFKSASRKTYEYTFKNWSNKLMQQFTPLVKLGVELVARKKLWPDFYDPQPIYDPAGHFVDSAFGGSFTHIYNAMVKNPTKYPQHSSLFATRNWQGFMEVMDEWNNIYNEVDTFGYPYYKLMAARERFVQTHGTESPDMEWYNEANKPLTAFRKSIKNGNYELAQWWFEKIIKMNEETGEVDEVNQDLFVRYLNRLSKDELFPIGHFLHGIQREKKLYIYSPRHPERFVPWDDKKKLNPYLVALQQTKPAIIIDEEGRALVSALDRFVDSLTDEEWKLFPLAYMYYTYELHPEMINAAWQAWKADSVNSKNPGKLPVWQQKSFLKELESERQRLESTYARAWERVMASGDFVIQEP